MRNVSNAFKERMNDRRDFYATAEITFADGTVKNLTKADFNIQGNSVIQGGATSSFPLGVLSSKQITLSLLNNDDKWEEYGFYNAQIKLATNYQTNEPDPENSEGFTPVIERLQEGIFTVITPETYGTTIEITAMDDSYKTDKEYTSSIQFPARLDDALRDCCAKCGITLYSDDIPNKDFIIQKKPEGISFRDFIGNCAMIAGGNAVMDNYNRLKIITYDFSVFSDQKQAANIPVLKDFKPGLRLEAIDVEITGLQITGEITETDEEGNETTVTDTFKYGEEGYVLTLTNELAEGNEEAFLQAVGNIIVGSRFRAFSGDSIADPLLEFMDVIYVRNYKGRVFQSFISDIDFSYFGMTVIKCSADSPLRNGQSGGRDPVKQLKQLVEKEKTEREKALERLNQMLKDSSGIYTTAEEQADGSVIMYIHNKPTVGESKYVIKITGEAMGISNDGGETYIYGLSYDGEATPTIKSTNNITITVGSMNYTLSTALYSTNSSSSLGTSSYAWASAYIKALTASGNVTLGSSTNSSVSIASGYNCYLGFFGTRPVSRKQVSTVPTNGTLTNAITGINNIISALKGYGLIS